MTVLLETFEAKNTGEFPRNRPFIDVSSRRKKIKKDASFSSIFSFEKCRGQRRTCVHRHGGTLVKKSKVAIETFKKKDWGSNGMDGRPQRNYRSRFGFGSRPQRDENTK